jgi:hypothetical protein
LGLGGFVASRFVTTLYFHSLDRIADALGTDLDPEMPREAGPP